LYHSKQAILNHPNKAQFTHCNAAILVIFRFGAASKQPPAKAAMNPNVSSDFFILEPASSPAEFEHEPDSLLYLATQTLRFEAAFLMLHRHNGGLVLGLQGLRLTVPDLPQWVLPHQPHLLHQSAQLHALAGLVQRSKLENALGVRLEADENSFGALWLVNSHAALQPHDLTVLKALAKHIATLCQPKPSGGLAESVLQALPIGVIATDQTGQVQQINQHYTTQFGYLLEDMKQRFIGDFMPSESQDLVQSALQSRARGESSLYRHKLYRKDGSIADVEVSGHPRFDAAGMVLGAVAVVRDISDELALEQAALGARRAINKKLTDTLLETRRRLEFEKNSAHEILEVLQEGFALIGLDGRFEYVNPAFAQICGMNPQAMLGLEAERFVYPEDLQIITKELNLLQPKQLFNYRHRVRQSTGEVVVVQARANLRFDTKQQVSGILLMARDISHELESLAKVEKLEQELERIGSNFQTGTGFLGRLETIGGAIGLMQMFSVAPINGAIQLDDSILFFDQGKIVAIVHPKLQGEEAVRAVVQRQRGQFQFIPDVRPERQSLSLDPTKIALELLTKHDESQAPNPKPTMQRVVLPNSKAAQAFMQGVGGRVHFQVTPEGSQVILTGRGFQIVVLEGKLEDF
jgi:PAS domain S-box-containing protein